ncbi:uncharacterized protein LOC104450201 [Eucalyptus grandis]|uniref:uncharacterized protein LOC104450201 n=1 Tax=Eucalyptus grandis TaxID=71139 RepID=UPI00192EC052|nr:uncharacterized protein LOC104450201 [Eucalyptus grandis]
MPTVWFALKKSLHCKSEPSDVHDPKTRKQLTTILTKKTGRSGCSRSIANLKDVIHGSKRHMAEKPPSCSPRSIGSSEFLNPLTHEVILSNTKCELKITGYGNGFQDSGAGGGVGGEGGGGGGSTFVGTLTPGTPMHYFNPSFRTTSANGATPRKGGSVSGEREGSGGLGGRVGGGGGGVRSSSRVSLDVDANGISIINCHKCGEQFTKWDAAEAHHLSKHAVTELVEGDSSRKIVEIICRTGWLKSENQGGNRIERVLKVHNMQKTLARFEEYREAVKVKASKLPKKHPRCLADGNELLRFYGTTVACPLGLDGSSSLCTSERCCVCRIVRHGFSVKKESKGGIGVFTTSTSGRAFESIDAVEDVPTVRKALIVCRVIAGRVHRPLENIQEMAGQTGFDSLAGKVGLYSHIEELYLLNPRALLPCFVVICKP